MNISEAAKALEISEKSLRRYIKQGKIEARLLQGKTGQEWQIELSNLEAFKRKKESGTVFPAVEAMDKRRQPGKSIARVDKPGTVDSPALTAVPHSLPQRARDDGGRYLETLPDVLSAEEVATFLGVGTALIRDCLREGKLRGVKFGRRWKISKDSLKTFMKELLG